MNLHILGSDKFTSDFINFSEESFANQKQIFAIVGLKDEFSFPHSSNIRKLTGFKNIFKSILFLNKNINNAEKVFIHGLFNPLLILFLFLKVNQLYKCYWLMLGGDLYFKESEGGYIKKYLIQPFRKTVIERIGYFVSYIEEDFIFLKKNFQIKGHFHKCLLYTSNVIDEKRIYNPGHIEEKILIGNSATLSNNHAEIIDVLKSKHNLDFEYTLVFPLSYGDFSYRKKIIRLIDEKLSKYYKIELLTDFMQLEEYLRVISSIRFVLFNHKRQQGMGNMIQLLSMGKTLYLAEDSVAYLFCVRNNINVKKIREFNFTPLLDEEVNQNIEIIKNMFSKDVLINDWKRIYES